MSTAIITKFIGPTTYRGSRIKAQAMNGRGPFVVVAWDYNKGANQNHDDAALQLASQLGWCGSWTAGDHENGRVYIRPMNEFLAVHESMPATRTVARRV